MADLSLAREKALARDMLELARSTLLAHLRFFDRALYSLTPADHPRVTSVGTDGLGYYFNVFYILKCFRRDKNRISRDLLHSLLHCILRHFLPVQPIVQDLWDLACDITVENIIMELNLPQTQCAAAADQPFYLATLSDALPLLTAETLYRYFADGQCPAGDIAAMQLAFCRDDHFLWYDGDPTAKERFDSSWKQISELATVDLQTESRSWGDKSGSLCANLGVVNRERISYAVFLQKFCTPGEALQADVDEFDYIYYSYGLSLYKNMPLVEPLEYKPVQKIREFVIAIDTSGSISEATARRFIQASGCILLDSDSFFENIRLYIIQCDAAIQHAALLSTPEEFHNYLADFRIHGMGGTDFRPVFHYVDELIQSGDCPNLQGLIYFTDGMGVYPDSEPAYRTAFLFSEDHNPPAPAWAAHVYLSDSFVTL